MPSSSYYLGARAAETRKREETLKKMSEEYPKSHKAQLADPSPYHDHHHHQPSPPAPQYGTFPEPVPPPGFGGSYPPPRPSYPQPPYYDRGYQSVPDHVTIVEGIPLRERRLACCGIGMGWFLFIVGFFLAAIPWYFGAFIVLFVRVDHREKPGYVACAIAAALATVAVIVGATKGANHW